ncbi:MAG: hypothetical protein IKP22_09595, partial [Clostridia bacterium]|nr:hypothetical protein [Clostridia bacterium]
SNTYGITVTVVDNGDGTLTVTAEPNGEENEFINTYKAEGSTVLTGVKILEGRELEDGQFSFTLEGPDEYTETVSNTADGRVVFSALTYDQDDLKVDGEYVKSRQFTYTMTEELGDAKGYTYATETYEITVTVTDNGDGTLEVVADRNGKDNSFVNTYEAKGSTVLTGVKILEGRELEDKQFSFTLKGPNGYSETVSNTADGSVVFSALAFDQDDLKVDGKYVKSRQFTYTMTEAKEDAKGYTYATETYDITVTVTDNGDGTLTVTTEPNGADNEFVNTYEAEGSVTLTGVKILEGRELEDGQFSFTLEGPDEYTETVSNTADGSVVFSALTFDQDDLKVDGKYVKSRQFTYTMAEVQGSETGYTYASRTYDITVTVTDNGDGTLTVTAEPNGADNEFVNTYEAAKGSTVLTGVKILEGRELEDGQFSFTLEGPDGYTETVSNTADGSVVFSALTFDQDDLKVDGKYVKSRQFTYTMTEVQGDAKGYTYASRTYDIVVTVVNNGDGTLTVTAEPNGEENEFVNIYEAKGSTVLTGVKILEGRKLEAGQFSFTLTGNGTSETATNAADGNIEFSALTFDQDDLLVDGEYVNSRQFTYTMTEVQGDAKGYTYAAETYEITVTVADNGDGTLTVTADRNGKDNRFVNTYKAKGRTVLTGEKILEGRKLEAGQFIFTLTGNGIRETATNTADGRVAFSALTFDQDDLLVDGEYVNSRRFTYTMTEVQGDAKGYTYATEIYMITVTVTDNGDGTLTVTAEPNGKKNEFTNTYEAKGSTVLTGVKVLEGRELEEGQFSFTLEGPDGYTETVSNTADGSVVFSMLTFDQDDLKVDGEYVNSRQFTYTMTEVRGDAKGYTYASRTYDITVTVVDNGDGTLSVTAEPNGEENEFVNTYEAKGSTVLTGVKILKGRKLAAGQFSFTLEGNGVSETVTNAADGNIEFPALNYTMDDLKVDGKYVKSRQFTYTMTEVQGDAKGYTYATETYEITVTVTDNGDGTLIVVADRNGKDNSFVNTYKAKGGAVVSGVKMLEGRELEEGQFSFTLSGPNGYTETVTNRANGIVSFSPLYFTEDDLFVDGEYLTTRDFIYTMTEVKGDSKGYTYSEASYTITVTVTDMGDGTLLVVARPNGKANEFVNTYSAKGSVTLTGVKILEGRELEEGQFSFTLEGPDGYTETVSNTADGRVAFSALNFDQDDLKVDGEYVKSRRFSYTMTEVRGSADGYTYASRTYGITVTVSDNGDGTLTVTAEPNGEENAFANTYEAKGSTVLTGVKVLEGRELEKGQFSFTLSDASGEIETVSNTADGRVVFSALTFDQDDLKVDGEYVKSRQFTYTMTEVQGDAKGYTYATRTYDITVTVTDNGDGTLTVTAEPNGEKNEFDNTYEAKGSTVLTGVKVLEGRELEDGQFSFTLEGPDGYTETVSNTADGRVVFSALTFDQDDLKVDGEYVKSRQFTYTMTEAKGDAKGYTYASRTYDITVTVIDNGDGTLTVTAEPNGNKNEFVNTYEAEGSVTLTGVKYLEGRELKEGEFTFEIREDGETIARTASTASGTFAFPAISYTLDDLGTHTYTVVETSGGDGSLKYDETVYTVLVEVTDRGDGTLKAEKTILKDGTETDGIAFVNRLSDTSLTIAKVQTGGTAGEQFTFRLEMTLNGAPLEGSYHYTGSYEGEIATGGEFKLKDGENVTVEGLPIGTEYKVTEVRNGAYITTVTVDGGEAERASEASGSLDGEYGSTVIFHNTQATTGFRVTKRWNGPDKGRINLYVYVGIKADVLARGVMEMKMMDPQPKLDRDGNYYSLDGLPLVDENGNELVYAVQEYNIPEDYYVSYINLGEYQRFYTFAFNEGEIINTYEGPKYVSINVYKRWSGIGTRDVLPDITLDVYRINPDRTSLLVKTLTVSAKDIEAHKGRVSIGGLLEGYYYYVVERPVPGYRTFYTNPTGGATDAAYSEGVITNHKIPKTGDSRQITLWIALAAASMAGICALAWTEKKKRRT